MSKGNTMGIIKNSNLNDKKKRIITNFFIIYKYEWYQYEGNKKTVLNRTKDYYENNKELLREKAGNKHRKLLEEGKNMKREYGWNIILKKYQNSYRQANKSKKSYQFYGFNDICYVLSHTWLNPWYLCILNRYLLDWHK